MLFSDSIASLSLDSKHIDKFVKHDAKQQKEHSAISLNAWDWATANTSSCLNLEASLNLAEYDSHFQQEREMTSKPVHRLIWRQHSPPKSLSMKRQMLRKALN